MPAQAAPREEPSPDAVLRAAAVGGVATAGGAGAVAASGPAATLGGAKGAVTGAQVAAAVAAAMARLRGARPQDADWLWLIRPMRREFEDTFPGTELPTNEDDILVRAARLEVDREREFFLRMEERLRQRIPRALASPEPEAAVEAVLRAEAAFLQAHEQASASRIHSTVQRDQVKQLSPEGAFWRLGALVKEHTPDCIALAAVGWWPWEVLDRIHPPMHPGCFPAGVVASGPKPRSTTTRWYAGDLVKLHMASGNDLAVTPNHPVLTPHGWVPAGQLNTGDDVVCGSIEHLAAVRPDKHQVPARIEEVAATVGEAASVTTRSVPVASHHFHGDGGGSQISVVRTNGGLHAQLQPSGFKEALQHDPLARHVMGRRIGLPGLRSTAEGLKAVGAATLGFLSRPGVGLALLGSQTPVVNAQGLRDRSALDSRSIQPQVYGAAGDAEVARKARDAFAGQVSLDKIVSVERITNWSGHVYNLDTGEGWYTANGVIVHNCACELLTHDEAVDLGLMPRRLPDTSRAVERADEIARAYGIIQEAYWLQTDGEEALAEAVAAFTELVSDLGPRPTRTPETDRPRGLIDYSTGTEMELTEGKTLLALQEADTETEEQHTGIMVALYPDSDVARDLSLRGGEHPDNLHVTLAFLGKTTEVTGEDQAVAAVRRWAEDCPVLKGEISGYGYFLGNHKDAGGKLTYASVDLPELPHQRERLVDDLCTARVPPRRDHGFTPHMTLDYASRRPPLDKAIPLTFSKVTLAWGDNHYSFPLGGKSLADEIQEGLVDYAKEELERAGLFSKDSDYEGMLGEEILKIVKLFSEGGHSGGSAAVTVAALEKLLRYQPLTPLTSDPSEWQDVSEMTGRPFWQSRRNPAAFSEDGGKTWEVMEAREPLPLTALDLEELAYERRFPRGTVNGGEFMPRRGGYSPRVQLSDIVRSMLAPGQLQDVSGPRGFDARRYQDPRRSLITKIRALPKNGTLEMADGSKVIRGQHGDSAYMVRPDGEGKRYATVNRLANHEIEGIVERHHPQASVGTRARPNLTAAEVFDHPVNRAAAAKGYSQEDAKREKLPLSDLIPTQDAFYQGALDEWAEEDLHPIVVRRGQNGKLYLLDGHHRAAVAKLRGDREITADVIEDQWKAAEEVSDSLDDDKRNR